MGFGLHQLNGWLFASLYAAAFESWERLPGVAAPGFMAVNYGARTPVSVLIAPLAYGAILGAFYRLR